MPKYLRYWWRSDSEIEPSKVAGPYYRVHYDWLGRYIIVEEFTPEHRLVSRTDFKWRLNRVSRTVTYAPSGEVQFTQVYHYGWLGNLQGVEKFSPEGKSLGVESRDL